MTTTEPTLTDLGLDWSEVCPVERLTPDRGVAALVAGRAIAVFHLSQGGWAALDNVDPCSGASVLSRGLVGDAAGVEVVASPMYKHRFDLRTGRCLDDDGVRVRVHQVRVVRGTVEVRLEGAT